MSGRIIPIVLEEGQGFLGIEPPCTFLFFYQKCQGTCECVIQMLMYYNELMMRLKVRWKSNLLDQVSSNQFYVLSSSKKNVPFPLPSCSAWPQHSVPFPYLPPLYFLPLQGIGVICKLVLNTCISIKVYSVLTSPHTCEVIQTLTSQQRRWFHLSCRPFTTNYSQTIIFLTTHSTSYLLSRYHNKLWKTLNKMGIPDHLICFLRNLYARQLEPDVEQQTGFKAVYCHSAYLTYMQSTS